MITPYLLIQTQMMSQMIVAGYVTRMAIYAVWRK